MKSLQTTGVNLVAFSWGGHTVSVRARAIREVTAGLSRAWRTSSVPTKPVAPATISFMVQRADVGFSFSSWTWIFSRSEARNRYGVLGLACEIQGRLAMAMARAFAFCRRLVGLIRKDQLRFERKGRVPEAWVEPR